jgi:hypothetical protein
MGIKFSVGVSDFEEDRRALEELRRKSPAGSRERGDSKGEAGAPGWSLQASAEDDEHESAPTGQSLWAW